MKLSNRETAHICRSLSLLLHAGIPLAGGCALLAKDNAGAARTVLEGLAGSLEEGSRLSQAMEAQGCFPQPVWAMAAIGEETGHLEEALASLSDFYDTMDKTARQVKSALTYPAMVLALMLAVIVLLLTRVMPVFARIYASLGRELTGVALGLLKLGQGLKTAAPLLLAAALVMLGMGIAVAAAPRLRAAVGYRLRKAFGDLGLLRKFNNARFAQALSLGLRSGLALEESLDLAARLLEHIPRGEARCRLCLQKIREGEELSQAMEAAQLLSPAHSAMLTLGLRCGSGDQVMEELSALLMEEAQEALETAVSRIEPAIVMVCSVLVGSIVLLVMLPLMDVLSAIG